MYLVSIASRPVQIPKVCKNIWDFLRIVSVRPIWDRTGALCWLIIPLHGQTQTVGESCRHHNPFSSSNICIILIQMLRLLHISIERHSERFVDGKKYQGPPWIDPWSEAPNILIRGQTGKRRAAAAGAHKNLSFQRSWGRGWDSANQTWETLFVSSLKKHCFLVWFLLRAKTFRCVDCGSYLSKRGTSVKKGAGIIRYHGVWSL